jgi:hypothetical protein
MKIRFVNPGPFTKHMSFEPSKFPGWSAEAKEHGVEVTNDKGVVGFFPWSAISWTENDDQTDGAKAPKTGKR